jgi:hypothetical protein
MKQPQQITPEPDFHCALIPCEDSERPRKIASAEEAIYLYAAHSLNRKLHRVPANTPGVYAFWDGERCMYVGESRNLRARLASHPRKKQLKACSIRWLACENHKQVEGWLIEECKPVCNGASEEFLLYGRRESMPTEIVEIEKVSLRFASMEAHEEWAIGGLKMILAMAALEKTAARLASKKVKI